MNNSLTCELYTVGTVSPGFGLGHDGNTADLERRIEIVYPGDPDAI